MRAKKPKAKKPRRDVPLAVQPSWNLGRHVRVTIEPGAPVPAFLKTMIVKTKGD